MSTLAADRDTFAPRHPPGLRSGLALAIVAHVLLVIAIAWSVNWRASEPESVEAELWAALPQSAAPRAARPEPTPAPPPPEPRPVPRPPVVEPQAAPRPDPQIAIERTRREESELRAEVERRETLRQTESARRDEARRAAAEREKQRVAAEHAERAEKAKLVEQERRDEARLAAIREANLKKMMSQAGASDDPSAAGTAARSAGPSSGYAGRIKARIKPNIVLTGSVSGNPLATIEVRVAPDGTIVGRKLVKSSGSPTWDETVLRAIDKTEVLPRDIDGRVPPSMTIEFRPQE